MQAVVAPSTPILSPRLEARSHRAGTTVGRHTPSSSSMSQTSERTTSPKENNSAHCTIPELTELGHAQLPEP